MLIARERKDKNIAEYLLYMWQVEDMIRAMRFDPELIRKYIAMQYEQPAAVQNEIQQWYEDLINMMRIEGVTEKGHLQININTLQQIEECHNTLLQIPEEIEYITLFYKTLPTINAFKNQSPEGSSLIEISFTALYGYMMLKIQKREISEETKTAAGIISRFLGKLAYKFAHANDSYNFV